MWVTDSERDVAALEAAGVAVATCLTGGAWTDHTGAFAGADVVIAVANSSVRTAVTIADALNPWRVSFRVTPLGSIAGYLEAGGTLEGLTLHRRDELSTVRRAWTGDAFVLDAPDHVTPVWGEGDGVAWNPGESLFLVGPPGVGKTTVGAQLVRARVGITDQVLGMPVLPGAGTVLYLACDRPPQIQRVMARIFGDDDRRALQSRLVVLPGPPPMDIGRCPELLLEDVVKYGADTLVVDSLKDIAMGLSSDEVGATVNRALQMVLYAGCEVLALHHTRKTVPGEPPTLADVYGSTWLTAGAGSVFLFEGDAGDPVVKMLHRKQPLAEVGPLIVEHDHDAGTSAVARSFDLVAYLGARAEGATATEVAAARYGVKSPSEAQRRKAERDLKNLENSGVARRREDDRPAGRRGVRYYLVPPLKVVRSDAR